MPKIPPSLKLLTLLAALSGCASANPPHLVGGACAYSSQGTYFTVIAKNANATEIVFTGQTADLPERVRNADFIATILAQRAPAMVIGRVYPGTIQQETSGTCTPIVYAVIIDGTAFSLEPRLK